MDKIFKHKIYFENSFYKSFKWISDEDSEDEDAGEAQGLNAVHKSETSHQGVCWFNRTLFIFKKNKYFSYVEALKEINEKIELLNLVASINEGEMTIKYKQGLPYWDEKLFKEKEGEKFIEKMFEIIIKYEK